MSYICIGDCYPPKEMFLFWDLVTGNAPVNDYTILGYQMLMMGYILIIFMIPFAIFIYVEMFKLINEAVPGKFDINGNLVKKHER